MTAAGRLGVLPPPPRRARGRNDTVVGGCGSVRERRQPPRLPSRLGGVLLVPPPVWALAAAVTQRLLPGGTPPPTASRMVAAAGLTLASAALAGGAGYQFRRHGTTVETVHPDRASALVTTGSNDLTRKPMYVGLTGVLLAHATWRGSWPALLPVAAFVGVVDRLQVASEEAALHEKFGAEYDAYRAAVPRWLGLRKPYELP